MNKNKVTLYHYSNKDLKVINPLYFGDNNYTFNDVKACDIKRTFFYLNNEPLEYIFKKAKYLYKVTIDKKNLYDLKLDKLGLKAKYNGDIKGLLSYCKRHYKGIIYNVGFDIASLFYNVKASKV